MKQAYKLLTILLFFFVCVSNGNAQTLSKGSGTETDPYLIESESDWNTFASDVNGGYPYSGKYVKLVADISVSTMVGASTHPYDVGVIKPFAGTFDGNGKTLVIDIKDVEDAYIAPFRFLDGATIKNIKVTGIVDAATYKQGASLVGRTTGTVNLINCHCSATIQGGATDNGYGSHGGIVGESNGWISFNNCVFDGKIDAPEVHSCGGFIGWITSNSLAVTFENCLMAGTVNCKTTNTGTFYCTRSYSGTLTDCYYVESIGEEQGTKAFAAPAETGFSKTITFYDDQACYCHGTSSFDITELKATDDNNVSLAYTVKYDGTTLTKGTDYEEIITDGDGNIVDKITPLGKYTLTVKGKVTGNNGYYGTYETELSQPYAVLEDDGKTLVFKCGVKPNGAYDMNEGEIEPACLPGWYNDGSNVNITKVVFDESFKDARPVSCYYWFSGCEKLTEIQNIQYFNTSEVTTMFVMFDLCTALTSIDLSHFDTRKVRNMGNMFKRLTLTTLDLSSFEMKNVKTDDMFKNSSNLTTIIVGSGWTKDQISSSTNMFYNCTSLIGNDGTTYDASKVDKTNAHANDGGYLTKDNYKIFFDGDATDATMDNCATCTTNSNDYIYTEYSDDFTLPAMKRDHYIFKGWKRVLDNSGNLETEITETVSKNAGNRWFKAQWEELPKYSVVLPDDFAASPNPAYAGENITVTYSGSSQMGSLKLVPLPTTVTITPSNLNLLKDVTKTLTAEIYPDLPEVNKAVKWTSSKPEVVSVTETSELQTTITTHAFGKALIKATTVKNNKSDSVWVICSAESPIYYVDPVSGDDDNDGVSESTAFKTFDAVFSYITDAEKDYIINFKGECTDAVSFDSYTAKSLTIRGLGSGTDYINTTVTTSDNSIIFENIKIKKLSGGAVLKDGAVTENVTTASNLTVSGSAKAGNVTLQDDAKIIIAGALSAATVATITPSNYNNQVVALAEGVTDTKIIWERSKIMVTPIGSDYYYVQGNGNLTRKYDIDEENDAAHPYILKIDDRRTSGNYSPELYAAENITDATTDKSFYITFDNWKRISDMWSACVNFFNYNAGTTFTYYITIEGTNSSTSSEYAGIDIGLDTHKETTGNIKLVFGTTTTGTFTFTDGKADYYQHPDFEVRGEMTGTLTFELAPGCTFSGTVGGTTYTDITEFFNAAQNHKGGSTMTITKN